MDERGDPGLGEKGTDTVSAGRVLAAPRTPTKAEREEHDVSHVPHRPWCRFCVMGRGLERRHLTQSGDSDDDRPRVFADYGYFNGDSTPLSVAKIRRTGMTFAAAVSMKGGGDPHAARLLAKWIDGLGCQQVTVRTDGEPSICELIRRVRELRAEGTTTVDEISPPGDSAGNGIAERAILTVGGLVRTTKAVAEENVLEGRSAGPRLVAWMVHHAAQVICTCMVGADGLTPFRRQKGRKCGTPLAGFGERVWLRDPVLERANKFNPRRTEARLLRFCLKSSRYIVVDCDGRFRMVRTIKRANADDRWKVVSTKDPFSAADLESTVAEFTCSRGTRGEVNPAAQRLERHPVHVLPRDPNRDPVPRRLYLKQSDFMAHGTSDRCPSRRTVVSGGRAQGRTEECRLRVEGELRKAEEGKARLRAAASREGDAPTGRQLKKVSSRRRCRDAEATSASATSSLPAEDATTNSLPAHSSEAVLPASATEVPDQVMSEGASSAPDAAVRLSMKRSSDSSHSESETKRLHTDHFTRDVVKLLDDPDVSRAVEQCREVCHRRERRILSM